jgi:hypothetical protein
VPGCDAAAARISIREARMSTAAIPVHVALVDMSGTIDRATLAEVAGALNEQVQADLAPVWRLAATVGAYPAAPPGTWRIELHDGIDQRGAAGYHTDEHHQPYALVDLRAGEWTVTASHELLEMLGDPWGSRVHTAAALSGWEGEGARVRYLVELCDPCERTTYQVGGVEVSDFLLPWFYRSSHRGTVSGYSHTGALGEPLEVLDGGYISFVDESGDWWQRFVVSGQVQDRRLGPPDQSKGTLREWIDEQTRLFRAQA